jgi:NADH pyrophosphatase NudC (nudix superfamily)
MIKQHEKNIVWQTEFKQKTDTEYKSDYIPVKFDQVKEKFGGLRIYHSGGDDYIDGLIGMAESFSYKICEICGERGQPNKGGWISTLCDECRNKSYDQTTNNNSGV